MEFSHSTCQGTLSKVWGEAGRFLDWGTRVGGNLVNICSSAAPFINIMMLNNQMKRLSFQRATCPADVQWISIRPFPYFLEHKILNSWETTDFSHSALSIRGPGCLSLGRNNGEIWKSKHKELSVQGWAWEWMITSSTCTCNLQKMVISFASSIFREEKGREWETMGALRVWSREAGIGSEARHQGSSAPLVNCENKIVSLGWPCLRSVC